jgi:hypothetical protein
VLPGTVKAVVGAGIFGGEDIVVRWQIQNLSECREKKEGGRVNTKVRAVRHASDQTRGTRKLWIKEGGIEKIGGEYCRGGLIAESWKFDISNLLGDRKNCSMIERLVPIQCETHV